MRARLSRLTGDWNVPTEILRILEDDQTEARDRERMALTRSIELMQAAQVDTTPASEVVGAVVFTMKLWTALVEDLADSANMLPRELRAQLISIGIWMLRELDNIRESGSRDFTNAIAVSASIRDGLT